MARGKPKFQKERPPDQHAVGTDWRLFVAVPIPPEVQAVLRAATERLSANDWPVRWVAAESAHLTLHFLGDTAPERAELLRMGLSSAVRGESVFEVGLGAPGVFPDFSKPRVLWVGLTGESLRLKRLAGTVGNSLRQLGFDIDPKPFRPHITIGRVRDDAHASLGREVERALSEPELTELLHAGPESFSVREVQLIRSYLERGGARHVPLASYPLGPRIE